jgi:hypothetical protein
MPTTDLPQRILVTLLGLVAMFMLGVGLVRAADPSGALGNPIEGYTAAGLLGLVLSWLLLKHLPAKDAQIEKLNAEHHLEVKELIIAFQTEVREQRSEHRAQIAAIVAEHQQFTTALRNDLRAIGTAITPLVAGRVGKD